MGAGTGIRLASLPAVLLLTPWGRSPGNSSGWLLSTAGERRLAPVTASRAADRQSRSNVTPPRFTRAGALQERSAANRVTAGRDSPPNTARPQREAPLTAPAVTGASPCDRAISSDPRARRGRPSLREWLAAARVVAWDSSLRLEPPRATARPSLVPLPSPAGVAMVRRDRRAR